MLQLNFNPFPNLETKRLLLRRVTATDVKEILELRSNAETMKYIPRPLLKTEEDALDHIANIDAKIETQEGINWAITLMDSPKLIGVIGHYRIRPEHYRAEVGYMLLPQFHGKGIIPEAIREVVKFGFEHMNLHSIEAIIEPANLASEKVLLKTGFTKEAHLKENEFFEGRFLDTIIYSLLNRS
ncbi:GNAT family N-acetyltransferase [Flavobacterium frigoris]|uniref:Ribosomal-protein-alanine acetyltransferase n=1 Tax=Flavobacterium frigoris (strain PS1) TaxID=1086011 RepID=H7FS03_FLAFP|nr:GNAT family N-acetyltransferase [Flavobacterium frigoris]EIA08431.1 ribosomal-protein-alanine acetyltransferase [Flavobacterium frigoris PS1]